MSSKDLDLQWFASPEEEGKTEQPSEHKLRKAREEGNLPKSQELNSALCMFIPVIVLIILAPWIFKNIVELIRFYFDRCTTAQLTDGSLGEAFYRYFIKLMLPIAISAMVAGIAGNIIQNGGFIFSTKPIQPQLSKILPKLGNYFKKTIFSGEGAFNVLKSILKVFILFLISYLVIRNDLNKMILLFDAGLWTGITHIAGMCAKLLVIASIFFLVISIPDYVVQRLTFRKKMMMTKQEVKEEYKQLEGDPWQKSKLRERMRELLSHSMAKNVAEADVVITNPTHYAVAVKYDKNTMQGPMVMAKGVDSMAQRIKQIARDNDVEIVENRPLARALYAEVEIGDIIPDIYYQALAIVLAKVYSLKGKQI